MRSAGPNLPLGDILIWAAGLCAFSSMLGAASEPTTVHSRNAPESNYRLYVGLDVEVLHDRDYHRVADFRKNQVKLGDQMVGVQDVANIRGVHETKLARFPVSLTEIDTERMKGNVEDASRVLREQAALTDYASNRRSSLLASLNETIDPAAGAGDRDPGMAFDRAMAENQDFAAQADQFTSSQYVSDQLPGQPADEFNTLKISAKVSSPIPVPDVYMAGTARIRAEETGYHDIILLHYLGDIGPEPSTFTVLKGDLPPNFEVVESKIYLYRDGRELVSNESAKQFELSRNEVLEYLTLTQQGNHRGATLDPSPAWELAPAKLISAPSPELYDHSVTVNVDENGQVTEIASSGVIPSHVEEVVGSLLFFPALDQGRPVAGVAHVNLREFFE